MPHTFHIFNIDRQGAAPKTRMDMKEVLQEGLLLVLFHGACSSPFSRILTRSDCSALSERMLDISHTFEHDSQYFVPQVCTCRLSSFCEEHLTDADLTALLVLLPNLLSYQLSRTHGSSIWDAGLYSRYPGTSQALEGGSGSGFPGRGAQPICRTPQYHCCMASCERHK